MIVRNKTHKAIIAVVVTFAMIGILFLLRMAFVTGVSIYMNAEGQKEDGDHEAVASYYLMQAKTGDFMEPYIAYYNAGTAFAKAEQPEMAERTLEMSLSKVDNDYNECYIRNNLALVQEQLGDYYMLSDMASTAETYYGKAVTTISESPLVCFPPPPPSGGGGDGNEESEQEESSDGNPLTPEDSKAEDSENGESMKETEERSEQKEGQAKEAQGETLDGKEQVEQEMDQSKSETDNQEDVSEQQKNQKTNPVDKPW